MSQLREMAIIKSREMAATIRCNRDIPDGPRTGLKNLPRTWMMGQWEIGDRNRDGGCPSPLVQ